MGLGLSFGPRFARVRVNSRGVRAYGSVGVGPVSYGWTYGGTGSSGGGGSRGGGGGTRVVYVDRMSAKEIREAGEEEARQDAAREKRHKREREERERERAEDKTRSLKARAEILERIAQRKRDWEESDRLWWENRKREDAEEAEEEARCAREQAREEAEQDERDTVEWSRDQKARVKKWVGHAKKHGATHAVISFSYADPHKKDREVTVPLDMTWRTVKEKARTGMGYLREEPVVSIIGTLDGQCCTNYF